MKNFKSLVGKGLKAGLIFGVSTGTTMIVKEVINNNTEEQKKAFAKLAMRLGSYALASYITSEVVSHTEKEIEEIREMMHNFKEDVKQAVNYKKGTSEVEDE